jgi:hypothetical protein
MTNHLPVRSSQRLAGGSTLTEGGCGCLDLQCIVLTQLAFASEQARLTASASALLLSKCSKLEPEQLCLPLSYTSWQNTPDDLHLAVGISQLALYNHG